MGWKKWAGILAIAIFVPFIGPLIAALLIAGNWIYLGLKVYVILLYLTLRVPLWLFVEIPLKIIGRQTQKGVTFFKRGWATAFLWPKYSVVVFLAILTIFYFFISLDFTLALLTSPIDLLSWIFGNAILFNLWLLGAFLTLMFFMNIYVVVRGVDRTTEYFGGGGETLEKATGAAVEGAKRYKDFKEGKGDARGVYDNIEASEAAGAEGEVVLSELSIPGDMAAILEEAPFSRAILGKAPAGAPLIEVIIFVVILMIAYVFAALLFGGVLYLITMTGIIWFGWFSWLYEPILGALGFAADTGSLYGQWFGTEFADRFMVDVDVIDHAEPVLTTYATARARVFCLLEGPGCLRQHMANETSRPGAEAVGQKYGLEIEDFTVGRDRIDIRDFNNDRPIPVSFTISNPRYGLRGIDALDVRYRIQIIDSGRGQENPYCDTGWRRVEGGFDITGDGNNSDIYPGTSASTGFLEIDDNAGTVHHREGEGDDVSVREENGDSLTVVDCEMLQPGAGETRTAKLYLKYGYFSQTTLSFDAMSLENLRRDPDVFPERKSSQTADTPVKTSMDVNNPVVFRPGEPESEVNDFSVRTTLETEERDIFYTVDDMEVRGSRMVEIADEEECSFEDRDRSRNLYEMDDDAKTDLGIFTEGYPYLFDGSRPRGQEWFTRDILPQLYGCQMQLTDTAVNSLSPAGETLTMGAAANYTAIKEDDVGRMRVLNSLCGTVDCPLLVSLAHNASVDYRFKTTCTGIDASNGCTAVGETEPEDWWDNFLGFSVVSTNSPSTGNASDDEIERGDVVLDLDYLSNLEDTDGFTVWTSEPIGDGEPPTGGVSLNRWQRIDPELDNVPGSSENDQRLTDNYAVIQQRNFVGERETELVRVSNSECEDAVELGPVEALKINEGQGETVVRMECSHTALPDTDSDSDGEDGSDDPDQESPEDGGSFVAP